MSRDPKARTLRASPDSLFRYLAVSQVLTRVAAGHATVLAVRAVADAPIRTFDGRLRRISERTLYRWLRAYRRQGLDGLHRQSSRRDPTSTVLDERLVSFAVAQKTDDPQVSIPEIIARAAELGLVRRGQSVDRSTLYRTLQRRGVEVGRRKTASSADTRRFAYPHRMQMILADGKHFRVGAHRARRVALFFLDDATRRGLGVIVGTAESSLLFLRGLHGVIRRFGLPSAIYLDHGAGFIAQDTVDVVAGLGPFLIHGTVAYPQGHGKIERFNRTAIGKVLRTLDRSPEVDPDCGSLTLRLEHWLHHHYDHTPHEALGGMTPLARFEIDSAALRLPESPQALDDRFVVYLERRVSKDHIVSVDSVAYEVPRGHGGTKVVLHRRVLTHTLHMLHQGRLIELHPVDLAANARTRRRGPVTTDDSIDAALPPSAADLAYARDFGPIVGADGGFSSPTTLFKETDS